MPSGGFVRPRAGRVCYFVNPPQPQGQPTGFLDCVAYGAFTGENLARIGPVSGQVRQQRAQWPQVFQPA